MKTNKLDFCMRNTNGSISAMWKADGCIETMTFMLSSKKEIINLLRNRYNLIVSKAQERQVYAL
jgi:hypothetical protein